MDFADLQRQFEQKRVLVIGDHCLDRNGTGSYSGYSRERESLPIFRIESETYNPGGAGNLAANFASLGATTFAAGMWGDANDPHRKILEAEFHGRSINVTGMAIGGRTPTFEKFYFSNTSHVIRLDYTSADVSQSARDALAENIDRILKVCDFVVFADYDETERGVCDRQALTRVAQTDKLKFGTSRARIGEFQNFDVLVINEKELFEAAGDEETETVMRAAILMSTTSASDLVVTQGGRGAIHYSKSQKIIDLTADSPLNTKLVPSIPVDDKIDPCGCGDAFLAAVSACVAVGIEYKEAIRIANAAARAALRKLFGAWPVTIDEIEKEYERGLSTEYS